MSHFHKRAKLKTVAHTILVMLATASAAQAYPDRPIRLVVPFSGGSNNDVIARVVADHMAGTLKQPIMIDNRVGGGGIVGANAVANAEADGYTMLFANTTTMVLQPILTNPAPYDPRRAFAPVSTIGRTPLILVVSGKSPYKSIADLVNDIRKQGNANYATAGNGTPMHLMGASFGKTNNLSLNPIPYRGSPEMSTAVLSGDVSFVFDGPTVVPFVKDGSMRALAVTGMGRLKDLPDVPTLGELGYRNTEYMVSWYGLVVPKQAPREVVDVLNAAVRSAIDAKQVKDRLATFGAETFAGSPGEMETFMAKSTDTWSGIIRDIGLRN